MSAIPKQIVSRPVGSCRLGVSTGGARDGEVGGEIAKVFLRNWHWKGDAVGGGLVVEHLPISRKPSPIGNSFEGKLRAWQPEVALVHPGDGGELHVAPKAEKEFGNCLGLTLRDDWQTSHGWDLVVKPKWLKSSAPTRGWAEVLT